MALTAKAIKGDREKRLEAGAPVFRSHRALVLDDNRDAADTLALVLQVFGSDIRTPYEPLESVAPFAGVKP